MISDYFGINILSFPFGFIVTSIYVLGFLQTNKIFLGSLNRRFLSDSTKLLTPFILFSIYITLINICIYINVTFAKNLIHASLILFLILSLIYLKNFDLNNFFRKIFKNKFINIVIILYFISYFIISSLPISDADSLSYHSTFGSYLIKYDNVSWLKNIHLIHADLLLSGFTEVINFIGLVSLVDNFGSYINFFTLLYIYYCLNKLFKKNKQINLIFLLIISSPIILPMIFSQKIYILPSFVLSILMFLAFKEKKLQELDFIIIFSSLAIILSFKVSFLLIVLLLAVYFLQKSYKSKKLIKNFVFAIFSFIIFFSPILLKNIYFHSDILPPLTGQILNENPGYLNDFASFLKSYDLELTFINLIFLPILFLVPHYGQSGIFYISLPNIGKIYGLQIYSFLFNKKKFNIKFITLILVSIISVIFSGNISTRWFLFIFFFIQIGLLNVNFKTNKIFEILLKLQTVVFGLFILIYSVINLNVLINNNNKQIFLKKYSNGYDHALKIKKLSKQIILEEEEYILYSHRSHFWTDINNNHINIGSEWMPLFNFSNNQLFLNSAFKDYIDKKIIKIIILRKKENIEKIIKNSFRNNCLIEKGSFSSNHATRNIFFSGKKEYNWLYFKNSNLFDCLK